MKKGKLIGFYAIYYVAATLLLALGYYVTLPAINPYSTDFWYSLAVVFLVYLLPVVGIRTLAESFKTSAAKKTRPALPKKAFLLLAVLLPIVIVLVGNLLSSPFFFAKRYASVIEVKDAEFAKDMPETEAVENIALMDSSSAAVLGDRELGSLSDMISQFEVSPSYTQINYKGSPKKVANLEYADFFKWLGNRKAGIPGHVMVDPVENTAEYCSLATPMRYVESGYLGDDLMRKLRFAYPTKIFGTPRFEIDDEGNPFFIVPCMKPQVFLFGAFDVSEVIVFDPTDGSSEIHSVKEIRAEENKERFNWIDIVYDGDLAAQKYNWKGTLSGGFFNSIIGNKGCMQTTDDYGYIMIDGDVWYFTGVTSVNSDKSNIGFILTNARTGAYKFYPVKGAEEHSAMRAAQGVVQEKGYVASFPALINIRGEATYIMVLKDANGLVQLYAMVNVEQYNVVATGATQEDAKAAYISRLIKEGILPPEDTEDIPAADVKEMTVTIDAITPVTTAGESYLYLRGVTAEGETVLLKKKIADDESVLFLAVGDVIRTTASPTDASGVYTLLTFEK